MLLIGPYVMIHSLDLTKAAALPFLALLQHRFVIFHVGVDIELVTLILVAHLETVLTVLIL